MEKRKGFTLVELIIAMAISAVVLSILYGVVSFMLNVNRVQNEFIATQDAIRLAGLRIEKDVRESSQFITINTNSSNCWEIKDEGPGNESHSYCISDQTLSRDDVFLTENIQSLSIEILDEKLVEIKLNGMYEGRTIEYEQKIYLRNGS